MRRLLLPYATAGLLILVIFLMSGCTVANEPPEPSPEEQVAMRAQNAQEAVDAMSITCRSGVEFLAQINGYGNVTIMTPHLQPDGSPYLCIHMDIPVDEPEDLSYPESQD